MDRRSLLKRAGFAALATPLFSNTPMSNLTAARSASGSRLLLSLQGPFVIRNSDAGGLNIVGPVGPNYADASFDLDLRHQGEIETSNNARLILGQNQSLKLEMEYTPNPQPQQDDILTLTPTPGVERPEPYFTLDVPLPDSIVPTRWRAVSISGCTLGERSGSTVSSPLSLSEPAMYASRVTLVWRSVALDQPDSVKVTSNSGSFCYLPDFTEDGCLDSCSPSMCAVLRLKLTPFDPCPHDEQIHAQAVTKQMLRTIGVPPGVCTLTLLDQGSVGCQNDGKSDDCRAIILRGGPG